METRIYECTRENYKKLQAILGENPYDAVSFSRQGYKLKEGKHIGGDADKYYLYIKADEAFFKFADGKLGDIAVRLTGEKAEKLIGAIEEEENAAESGIGSIFG
ncbi:MAG: hypothetical protein QXP42_04570 [Candidatus Micrarchaeia archaeon]